MRKFVLEEYVLNGYNASSKAREDISKFILENGFESIAQNDKRHITNPLSKMWLVVKIN